ncbi:MAG: dephospho-CoA kinase [Spirochaetia bacterium]|nr:dephospho-CoA kinase [Spirochaetia bacterium]
MKVTVIGLTGKACAGKNQYGRCLQEHGLLVIDVDKLGHEALDERRAEVGRLFPSVVTSEGQIDRRLLGNIVFKDKAALERLDAVIHPVVKQRCRQLIQEEQETSRRVVVLNAALLKRGGLDELCDEIIFVSALLWVRCRRSLARDRRGIMWFLHREWSQKDISKNSFHGKIPVIVFNNNSGVLNICRQVDDYCAILTKKNGFR